MHTASLSNSGEDRTRDVKPPTAPSSELGVSSGSEEDGWRKDSEDEADVECSCCAGLFCARTTTVKNGFETNMFQVSTQSANCRNGLGVWQVQEMTDTCLLWPLSATKNLIL